MFKGKFLLLMSVLFLLSVSFAFAEFNKPSIDNISIINDGSNAIIFIRGFDLDNDTVGYDCNYIKNGYYVDEGLIPSYSYEYTEDYNNSICYGFFDLGLGCEKTFDGNWSSYGQGNGSQPYPTRIGWNNLLFLKPKKSIILDTYIMWKAEYSNGTKFIHNVSLIQDCWDYSNHSIKYEMKSANSCCSSGATIPDRLSVVNLVCFYPIGGGYTLENHYSLTYGGQPPRQLYESGVWFRINNTLTFYNQNVNINILNISINEGDNISVSCKVWDGWEYSDYMNVNYSFVSCTPDWSCNSYASCTIYNNSACLSVIDLNSCNVSFSGNLSYYDTWCGYSCTPNWRCTQYNSVCNRTHSPYIKDCSNIVDINNCGFLYAGTPKFEQSCYSNSQINAMTFQLILTTGRWIWVLVPMLLVIFLIYAYFHWLDKESRK